MKKYFAELIGTFALVFAGTGAIIVDEQTHALGHVGVAISFGLIVCAMIYSIGDISGAHLNPAVTVSFWAAGRMPVREIFPYVISQLAGAFLASFVLHFLFPANVLLGATLPSGSIVQAWVMEFVLSFLLMFVIINVASGEKEKGHLAGLSIGGTVLLDALFGGPITGASMNPARSLSPAIVSGHTEQLWIYLTAPFAGALVAIACWQLIKKS